MQTATPAPRPLTLTETITVFQSLPEAVSNVASFFESIPRTISNAHETFRALGGAIARGFRWLDRHLPQYPLDPYGRPVPEWNVELYVLAFRAYRGDWDACAAFLDKIEADRSPENVLLVRDLLGPTFGGGRTDLRTRWERETPEVAQGTLKKLLEDHKNRPALEARERWKSEHIYEHERRILAPSELANIERKEDERSLYERLQAGLPEQRFMFCWYRGKGMSYQEISVEMGISVETVKVHARKAKADPRLREMLGQ